MKAIVFCICGVSLFRMNIIHGLNLFEIMSKELRKHKEEMKEYVWYQRRYNLSMVEVAEGTTGRNDIDFTFTYVSPECLAQHIEFILFVRLIWSENVIF